MTDIMTNDELEMTSISPGTELTPELFAVIRRVCGKAGWEYRDDGPVPCVIYPQCNEPLGNIQVIPYDLPNIAEAARVWAEERGIYHRIAQDDNGQRDDERFRICLLRYSYWAGEGYGPTPPIALLYALDKAIAEVK